MKWSVYRPPRTGSPGPDSRGQTYYDLHRPAHAQNERAGANAGGDGPVPLSHSGGQRLGAGGRYPERVQDSGSRGAGIFFLKPRTGLAAEYERSKNELLAKLRVLSGVSVFTQHRRQATSARPVAAPPPTPIPAPPPPSIFGLPGLSPLAHLQAVPRRLLAILQQLPRTFRVPILCVQHISAGFLQGLVDWLDSKVPLRVTIARAGETPQPGVVYFPPERHHLELDAGGRLSLSQSAPVAGHCPSVTVLFQAVASYYRRSAVGILLTGMGRDGADGLLTMAQAGGLTIAQDELSWRGIWICLRRPLPWGRLSRFCRFKISHRFCCIRSLPTRLVLPQPDDFLNRFPYERSPLGTTKVPRGL